ncbi:MAG: hypothetical protein IPK63_15695 [Candidatus Competibacteraceae bacterium]|nr:hypothetical protein [Candidatus Competibacteraceae bacterium]MBK8184239.1 hypothetical protein [Candidatus Competibacteraceae bacterium]
MGSGGSNSSSKSTSGTVSLGGVPLSTTTYKNGKYSTNISLNPAQKSTWDASTQGVADLMPSISSALAVTPEQRATYADQLYSPVAQSITDNYNLARNNTYSRFANIGGLNSLGFNRYNSDVLTKNENIALQNARTQAELNSYQLPSLLLNPIAQALNMYQSAQSGVLNPAEWAAGTSGSLSQQAYQNYQNDLNYAGSSGGVSSWAVPAALTAATIGSAFVPGGQILTPILGSMAAASY